MCGGFGGGHGCCLFLTSTDKEERHEADAADGDFHGNKVHLHVRRAKPDIIVKSPGKNVNLAFIRAGAY